MGDTPLDYTSLDAVTATGGGTSRFTRGNESIAVTLRWTGQPTAVNVTLQARGRSDTDWTQIGAAMIDAPGADPANFYYQYGKVNGEVRLNLATMTAGTSPALTGIIHLGGDR